VYPCTLVPFTDIWSWYHEGTYTPYSQEALQDVLLRMKAQMFPWIRLNRIIRDIPADYVPNDDYRSDLRNELGAVLESDGLHCRCIRCREIKSRDASVQQAKLVTRIYNASEGTEYFISKELTSKTKQPDSILGFVRLRITNTPATHVFPELEGCALIRELHVYGMLQAVSGESISVQSSQSSQSSPMQHKGIGRELMREAERIAKTHAKYRMAVIAGEGTKGYYKKLGYVEDMGKGAFMIKDLL
jgi:ELP3 family radical SAM enzyme/protein acetyltransferase